MTDDDLPDLDDVPEEHLTAAAATVAQVTEAITVAEAAKEAKPNDVAVLAVKGIILITFGALAGAIALLSQGKDAPDGVIAISSAGMGALSTLLTVRPLYGGQNKGGT